MGLNIAQNTKGQEMIWLALNVAVSKTRFIQALTEHCFSEKNEFLPPESKAHAKKILISSVLNFGREGEYSAGEEIGSDHIDEYESIWSAAKNWVERNYPKLK